MKKMFVCLFATVAFAACGNNSNDSTKAANEANEKKLDTTKLEDDAEFAVAAADGGRLEVELGKLAQTNAASAAVKEFGQMMVDDHGKAGEELKSLAASKNITLPAALSNKHQDTYNDLAKKKGKDFDKSYASLMVDDHKDDVDEFKKQADKGKDPDLKKWAAEKVPVLEHHLMMARRADSLAKKE